MVATAPPSPSSPAGPSAQGRGASRIASDRRRALDVLPENDVFDQRARRRLDHAVATCLGRPRPHRRDSHRARRRFSGQTRDGRYCRARYYHPGLQRFISEDPIGFAGGDSNLYVYVENSPISASDPLGLLKFSSFGGFQLKGVATPTMGCCGAQVSVGYRIGSTQASPSAVKFQGYANAQLLRGLGLSAGRGAQVGFAFADVEELPQLREVAVDTPLLGISLFVREGGIPVGVAIGGPSRGVSVTASHPDWPGKEWSLLDYSFDWKDVINSIWGPPGAGNAVRLSGRK